MTAFNVKEASSPTYNPSHSILSSLIQAKVINIGKEHTKRRSIGQVHWEKILTETSTNISRHKKNFSDIQGLCQDDIERELSRRWVDGQPAPFDADEGDPIPPERYELFRYGSKYTAPQVDENIAFDILLNLGMIPNISEFPELIRMVMSKPSDRFLGAFFTYAGNFEFPPNDDRFPSIVDLPSVSIPGLTIDITFDKFNKPIELSLHASRSLLAKIITNEFVPYQSKSF